MGAELRGRRQDLRRLKRAQRGADPRARAEVGLPGQPHHARGGGDRPDHRALTWLGHVFEHVATGLQNIAGEDVSYGKTRSADPDGGRPGVYTMLCEHAPRHEGIEFGERAVRLQCSVRPTALRPDGTVPDDWDRASARTDCIRCAQRALGPSTAALVKAAQARPIPWLRRSCSGGCSISIWSTLPGPRQGLCALAAR